MKTRQISGRKITLEKGTRYHATRPIARFKKQLFNITIADDQGNVAHTIPALTYDDANLFLNAFNNGQTSFDGRVW
jgi:hypothetical protein